MGAWDVNAKQIFHGYGRMDNESYVTLFAGPDPADKDRMLVRKLIKLDEGSYAYEETRVNRNDGGAIHTQLTKVHGFDLNEKIDNRELNIRGMHRAMPHILGFSLYYRPNANHLSIVENTLEKASGSTWGELMQNLRDKRDMSTYLKRRFFHL